MNEFGGVNVEKNHPSTRNWLLGKLRSKIMRAHVVGQVYAKGT